MARPYGACLGSGGPVRRGDSTDEPCEFTLVAFVGPGLYEAASPAPGGSVTVVEAAVPVGGMSCAARTEDGAKGGPDGSVGRDRCRPRHRLGGERGRRGWAAKAIGAELACSCPIAEGVGWLPKNRYLRVSGAVIQPQLYLALGNSGQVQHMVGVNGATTIVAINKDKSAPIFHHCDLGLVADLSAVLPTLADQLA